MRLFFAIPLPGRLQAALREWQEKARGLGLAASYSRPEGMHLTLVFLGMVEAALLPELGAAASRVTSGTFELRTSALGVFPPRGNPRVVWLGLEPCPPLMALQTRLGEALKPLGFPSQGQPYAPHLTLARPKHRQLGLEWPKAPPPFHWAVQEMGLFESIPAGGGHRYELRGCWRFNG